jgi:phosphoribosyl-ATP pyrophosphohydrolase
MEDDGWDIPLKLERGDLLTVTTSYPRTLETYAEYTGFNLKVNQTPRGSCEAYVVAGDSDLTFDIKSTGKTIKENGLKVYREGERVELRVFSSATSPNILPDTLGPRLGAITRKLVGRVMGSYQIGSYTAKLLRDQNTLTKKYGEECAEFLQAMLRQVPDRHELVNEAADLFYVVQVALAKEGLGILDVLEEDIQRNEVEACNE